MTICGLPVKTHYNAVVEKDRDSIFTTVMTIWTLI